MTPEQSVIRKASNWAIVCLLAVTALVEGCGPPHNHDIVYKKMTVEEFNQLPPEEQETPEVQENMGALWRDPSDPKTATNPKRRRNAKSASSKH